MSCPRRRNSPSANVCLLAGRDTISAIMKFIALPFLLALPLLMAGCLQLTPNVSTDFSEIEARATFEAEVRDMCAHRKSRIPAILEKVEEAEVMPTIDHWVFTIEDLEAQVFPSGLITGEYHRHIQENLCR